MVTCLQLLQIKSIPLPHMTGQMIRVGPAQDLGERKLAAVMACDVVGYSRLIALDETGTLSKFKNRLASVIRPNIEAEHGRLVKTMGDGVLAEFPSAVECVRCAVAIQEQMASLNAPEAFDRRMDLRVGINVGDIVVDGADIFGDPVVVACRLQATADIGGIALSEAVATQLKGRVQIDLEPRGEVQLKNISQPVRVWRVNGMSGVAPPAASLALPDKPCIAVLPFVVMGASDDQDALADGLTEDIITALSRIHNLFVIARNSTFTYKGRAVDIKQVARELGVQYVLEGSVRQAAGRLRITAQLIDASSGTHVWAEKYDRDRGDVFELQDEITRNVAASVQTELIIAEGERRRRMSPRDLRVADLLHLAWRDVPRLTRQSLAAAREAISKVRVIDPQNARAYQIEAAIEVHEAYLGFAKNPTESFKRAFTAAQHAVELDDTNEYAHWVYGFCLMQARRYDDAVETLRRAIGINPNCSLAYGTLGTVLMWMGRPEESIRNQEIAIRSDPRNPSIFFRFFGLSGAYIQLGRYMDAVQWAHQTIQRKPDWDFAQLFLAAALGHLGNPDEAAVALASAEHVTNGRIADAIQRMPFRRDEDRIRISEGLAKARRKI